MAGWSYEEVFDAMGLWGTVGLMSELTLGIGMLEHSFG